MVPSSRGREGEIRRRISVFVVYFLEELKGRICVTDRARQPWIYVMGYDDDDGSNEDNSPQIARPRGYTAGVAPSFKSAERAEKRREYYMKLEQQKLALEAEKMEAKMRAMEEEEAALKQFRKNLFVKAHPVPSFYREGPPPKIEPKKIPVTRAKSPELTRRRSCNDSCCPSMEDDKGSCSRTRRGRSTTPNSVRNK